MAVPSPVKTPKYGEEDQLDVQPPDQTDYFPDGPGGAGIPSPTTTPQAPAAPVGHNGTQNGMNREQYRDAWMGSGIKDIAGLKNWIGQYGGTLKSDNGTVTTPYGEDIDMLIGARTNGAGSPGWGATGADAVAVDAARGIGAAGAGAAPATSTGGAGFQDQIRQILLQQLQGLAKPYDPNTDPAYKTAMGAASSEAQRVREQRQRDIAERLAAQGFAVGGGGGALAGETAQAFEDQSNSLSSLAGQMVQREVQSRKSQLTQMLNMALQTGDAEAARAIQLQIAEMDAQLRRMGLSQSADQFSQGLEWDKYKFGKLLPTYYL